MCNGEDVDAAQRGVNRRRNDLQAAIAKRDAMMTPTLDVLKRTNERNAAGLRRLLRAVELDGYILWKGRKVLLTYEDTGKRTNECQGDMCGQGSEQDH